MDSNFKCYCATAPLGMHPLGGVCSGPLPGMTELRVTGSGPSPAGSGGAGEPQREAVVRDGFKRYGTCVGAAEGCCWARSCCKRWDSEHESGARDGCKRECTRVGATEG